MHLRRTSSVLSLIVVLVVATFGFAGAAGAEKVTGADQGGRPLTTELLGTNEVPPAVDPDASGSAVITLNYGQGEVCWSITTSGTDPVVAAHIHRAPAGVNGPVVVPLTATQDGTSGDCAAVDRALIREIMKNPAGFYVNVHTTVFPAGALRGQLG